jgi:RNA polymerase sigma-70 factor (ECF subfamily)
MSTPTASPVTVDELLAHAGWARRLALRLTAGDDSADDLVQEAWIAAAAHPPASDRPLRPWLAVVLRNLFLKRRLGDRRREAREAAAGDETEGVSPEVLLARVETQRLLAELVASLEEPYRQALILRYFEDLSAAEIGRRLDIPAGTVRWRLKTALDELRARMRDRHGDRPERLLAPLLTIGRPRRPRIWPWAVGAVSVGAAVVLTVAMSRGRPARPVMAVAAAPGVPAGPGPDPAPAPPAIAVDLSTCRKEVARLRTESAIAEVDQRERLLVDASLFALGTANPAAAAALTPAIERIMKGPWPAAPSHTLECRTWACRMLVVMTREEAARVNEWMLPLQRDPELRERTTGFGFENPTPTKDPLSGVPLDRSEVFVGLADPSGKRVPHPRPRAAPAVVTAPLPASAAACVAESQALRLRLQQARADIEAHLSPVERFARGAPAPKLTAELRARLQAKFPGAETASLEVECRALVCRARWERGPARWHNQLFHEPWYGTMVDRMMPGAEYIHFTMAPGPRADGLAYLKDLVKRFEAGPARADCQARFPARGDLWVKLDIAKTGEPNDHGELGKVAVSYGNALAGTPLGKCVEAAIAALIQANPLPKLPVGATVVHYHLEFPYAPEKPPHEP